jgi:hypothetical protein
MIFTKSQSQRLVEALIESLDAVKSNPRRSRLRRVTVAAGSAAALTAASAGISSFRRRQEARRDS